MRFDQPLKMKRGAQRCECVNSQSHWNLFLCLSHANTDLKSGWTFYFFFFLVWVIYPVQKSWWQNHEYKQELSHKIQNSRHRRRKRVNTNWLTRNSQTIMSRIFRYHLLFKLSDPSSEGTCNQTNTEWVPEQMSWWNMSLKTNRFSAAFPTKRQRLRLRNTSRFLNHKKICALEGLLSCFLRINSNILA